ncbi:MAG: hypothetical protein LBU22_14710 [Dysgonamonadaceae bacterium]|jgi:cardiolipin synthase|nr:hypothetical protein [Dysgonamonadaceae bacterium]
MSKIQILKAIHNTDIQKKQPACTVCDVKDTKNHLIQRKSIRSLTQRPVDSLDGDKIAALKIDDSSIKLSKLLYRNGGAADYVFNKIDVLSSGESSFESIFETIRNTKNYIHIKFFIFADDKISNQWRDTLVLLEGSVVQGL